MLLQTLALLFTAQCAVCMHLSSLRPQSLRTPRHLAVMMVDGKDGLPPGIADRLSFQTGGSKVANQEEEALILWGLVKECYPSEEAAVTAVNKNSLILNPSMNRPSSNLLQISNPWLPRLTRGCRALPVAAAPYVWTPHSPWQSLQDNGHLRVARRALRSGGRHGNYHQKPGHSQLRGHVGRQAEQRGDSEGHRLRGRAGREQGGREARNLRGRLLPLQPHRLAYHRKQHEPEDCRVLPPLKVGCVKTLYDIVYDEVKTRHGSGDIRVVYLSSVVCIVDRDVHRVCVVCALCWPDLCLFSMTTRLFPPGELTVHTIGTCIPKRQGRSESSRARSMSGGSKVPLELRQESHRSARDFKTCSSGRERWR